MALSGTVSKIFKTGWTLKTEWSATQNISGNYSTVTCTHKLVCANAYGLDIGARSNSCIVGGVSKTFTSAAILTGGGTTITLGTTTHTINHNADGTASVALSTTFNIRATLSGSYVDSVTASGTITINTIPRASSVTCNSFNIGDSTTIVINRATSSFTHTIKYVYGTLSGTIAEKTTATTIGWTPNTANFYGQIPNGTTGYGSVTCETYNGNTLIGTTTANFNAYAKQSDCVPTVSATIADTNTSTSGATGNSSKIVRYISKPKVTIAATPKYSATIKSYRIAWGDGQTSTASNATFSNGVESPLVTVTATDSRGYSTTVTYDLSALSRWVAYIFPTTTAMTVARTESTSETVNLRATANYFNGSFGASSNTGTFSYRYRISGGTWGGWTLLATSTSGNTMTGTAAISGISTENSYDFQVKLSDYFNTSEIIERNVSKSIGILRVADKYVRVNGDIYDKYKTTLGNGLAKYRTGGVDIDPNTTIEELVLTETNTPSGFYYVRTVFYSTKSATANRTQIAYPYATGTATAKSNLYTRIYINGTGWSEWQPVGGSVNATGEAIGNALMGGDLSIEWGKVTVTPVANTPTTQVVYFGKTYEQAPIVLTTASTGVIGTGVLGVAVAGVSKTYATLVITRTNTVPTGIHFAVIGKVV